MASSTRLKLTRSMTISAVILLVFAAQCYGRFLVEPLHGLSLESSGEAGKDVSSSEDFQAEESAESVATFAVLGPRTTSHPIQWFQQQLRIFEALENAVMQSLQQQMVEDGSAVVPSLGTDETSSQQEQLRQVGSARLRAALLDKVAQDASASLMVSGSSSEFKPADAAVRMAGLATAGSDYPSGDDRGEGSSDDEAYLEELEEELVEFYEDYGGSGQGSYYYGAYEFYEDEQEDDQSAGNDAVEPERRMLRLLEGEYTPADDKRVEDKVANADKYTVAASAASAEDLLLTSALPASEDAVYEYNEYDSYDKNQQEDDFNAFTTDLADLTEDDAYEQEPFSKYGYDHYDDYEAILELADVMLAKIGFSANSADDEWADYLEQAYEYFTVYVQDDKYDTYTDVYLGDAPDALTVLASIAELVLWSHMGNFVLEVRPGYSIVQPVGDGPNDGTGAMILISDGVSGPALMEIHAIDSLFPTEAAPVEVVDDMYLHLVYPDGSLNWGLVTLAILAACTLAMIVGFFISWVSLRRSMRCHYVYVPQRPGKRVGCGKYKGFDSNDGDLSKALVLKSDECWNVVAVEDASKYIPAVVSNDSVAKAFCK